MSQGFVTHPAPNAPATSAELRDNFDALLTSNSGASLPGYAKEGMPFFSTANKHLHVAKQYGSKAFGEWLMGATIRLAVSLVGSGDDGNDYQTTIRLRTNSIMGGADESWVLMAGSPNDLILDFNRGFTPAYFAATKWNDPTINDPVLWTADGYLLGKSWELIPSGDDEIVYSASPPGFLSNISPFANSTLRAVDVEEREIRIPFTVSGLKDHMVWDLPTVGAWKWWEYQDGLLTVDLYQNGVLVDPDDFKFQPFVWGGVLKGVLYHINPAASPSLQAFDSTARYELRIRKDR